jgi:hypothetical protein
MGSDGVDLVMTIYIVCYIISEYDDETLHYDKAYLKLENAEKIQAKLNFTFNSYQGF